MANRVRSIQMIFRVTEQERELIHRKMEMMGVQNMQAYLRKMAIDGYSIKLDLPELKGMISLLRRCSNNLNQIARRANETGRVYQVDMDGVLQMQQELWKGVNQLLMRLGSLS